jgi:hypothetical protein
LPAHVLIVHVAVVFVPLAALVLVAAAVHSRTARRLGVWLPVIAAVAFVSVLAAMNAGGWLQNHVANTALVRQHTQLAGQLWPFSAGVLLLALAVWWFRGRSTSMGSATGARPVRTRPVAAIVVLALSVIVAAGSVVEVYRIGDSGSRAAWHDHFTTSSTHKG